MKMTKRIIIPTLLLLLPVLSIVADKLYGRIKASEIKDQQINVEVGDLIFRTNSYILSGSNYYYKSGMPGHLAIAVSESTFSCDDESLGNIDVMESAKFNRSKKKFQSDVALNKAHENFGRLKGRRFLLKMHLSADQKQTLKKLLNEQIGKPYSIFATKKSQQEFHCATLAHWAILNVAGIDLDTDGGIVFPTDILRNPRFDKPGDRIRF